MRRRLAQSERMHHPLLRANELVNFDGHSKLFHGAHPQPQLTSAILLTFQVSTRSAEPQPSEKPDLADAFKLERRHELCFHDLAALAKDSANGLSTV